MMQEYQILLVAGRISQLRWSQVMSPKNKTCRPGRKRGMKIPQYVAHFTGWVEGLLVKEHLFGFSQSLEKELEND